MGSHRGFYAGVHTDPQATPAGDGPEPEPAEAWQHRYGPPDNEVPVGLPVTRVLSRADDLVVVLVAIRAYSTGIQFDLALRLKQPRPDRDDLFDLFMNGGRRGTGVDERFLLGFEFADGRAASNVGGGLDAVPAASDPGSAQPMIGHGGGGGGGGRTFDQTLWLTPLPPPGPLKLICAWPLMGLPETAVVLDGRAIAEAGAAAEELWPWEPERHEPEAPAPAEMPPGWFADHARPPTRSAT